MRTFPAAMLLLLSACSTTSLNSRAGRSPCDPKTARNVPGAQGGGAAQEAVETEAASQDPEDNDPFETLNRVMFGYNRILDKILLRPAAKVYRAAVPEPLKQGFRNFYGNIMSPVDVFNYALQADGKRFAGTLWRFLVNSTIGVFGLFDVAGRLGAQARPTSFNETMKTWNVKTGSYLMLPVLGPSSVRGAVGLAGDTAMNPLTYLTMHKNRYNRKGQLKYWYLGMYALNTVDTWARLLDSLEDLEATSDDLYVTVRSLYFQQQEDLGNEETEGAGEGEEYQF